MCDPATACALLGYTATAVTGLLGVVGVMWRRIQALIDQSIKREKELAVLERDRASALERVMWERASD